MANNIPKANQRLRRRVINAYTAAGDAPRPERSPNLGPTPACELEQRQRPGHGRNRCPCPEGGQRQAGEGQGRGHPPSAPLTTASEYDALVSGPSVSSAETT